MALVGQAVSEKKIFEIVDGRRTDAGRRTDDGRTPDHGHPISSPCEPNGSGELKMYRIYTGKPEIQVKTSAKFSWGETKLLPKFLG